MQLLGQSLEMILNKLPKKRMSLKTVSMLTIQMINILKSIHNKNFIHRDIKPDNFTMGLKENKNKLFIIDFGLSKRYRDPNTLIQNPLIKKKKLTGTARYASRYALEGYEQSRRDDLESVGYVIIYLLKGNLPWQSLLLKNKNNKYSKILEKKKEITEEELCKGLPIQIKEFLIYVRNLKYEEEPNYHYMNSLFLNVLDSLNEKFDNIYDWNINHTIIYNKSNKYTDLLSIQSKFNKNSFLRDKKNTFVNSYINPYSISYFINKQNETSKNFLKNLSSKRLYLMNNITDDFNKSSQISEECKNNNYTNKLKTDFNKKGSLIQLYKSNIIDDKKDKCISNCCCIM